MDIESQVNAIERRLGSRKLPEGEARVLTIAQTYPSPIDEVWDVCTSAERIPRWFLPITGDLVLGGKYQLEGNAGGTIQTCDPPTSFAATWEYGGQVSWITVNLTAVDDARTRFELEHVAPVDEEFWDLYGPGAVGLGWESGFLGLALHLANPNATKLDETTWPVSEEGRRFFRLTADRYIEVQIAFGDDPGKAKASGNRTFAAYSPES